MCHNSPMVRCNHPFNHTDRRCQFPACRLYFLHRENTIQLADHEVTHVRFDPYQRASGLVLARLSGRIGYRAGGRWHDSTLRYPPGSVSTLWSTQHDESVELDVALTCKERKSRETRDTPEIEVIGARLSIGAAAAVLLLLASLHVLSPEFDPSFRMVSEYALGHYGWVLSLMFLAWGISSWALAVALWSRVKTRAGKVGLWFLVIAGLGEAMASVFDITHDPGHSIAGVLGIVGFPIAAVLLSVSFGRLHAWRDVKRPLIWLANLSWISVVLLVATLVLMTVQFAQAYGGQLPQHAPAQLPSGVLGLDGWADRLFVLSSCLWMLVAAWQAMKLAGRKEIHR